MCWGEGLNGNLGNGATADKDHPVYVVDGEGSSNHLSSILQISAGSSRTCALKSNGKVLCWGKGESGRLGNGATADKDHPVYVVDGEGSSNHLSGIIQISAGASHTCALNSDGEVLCWGTGGNGRLGNDAEAPKDHPVYVVNGDGSSDRLNGIVQISSGGLHSCALNSGGAVLCWGGGTSGQLGNDGVDSADHPVYVVDGDGSSVNLNGVVQIGVGSTHSCAFQLSGEVLCWGNGGNGRLGNNAANNKDHPVSVVDGDGSEDALTMDSFYRGYFCDDEHCTLESVTLSHH